MATSGSRPFAVVTGASRGIGLELARQFAEHGFDLIIAAEDGAINTAAEELANGASVEAVQVDLATEQAWRSFTAASAGAVASSTRWH